MSKIRELLVDNDSILVFDVDGVLAVMEWGEYNHYEVDDEEWARRCANGINAYTEDKVIKKMQEFIKTKDTNKIYVVTTVGNSNEEGFKKEFVEKYYGIPRENLYGTSNDNEKIHKLIEIKNKYPELEDRKLIMIEDSVSILNEIMQKTGYSTAHISSFFNM